MTSKVISRQSRRRLMFATVVAGMLIWAGFQNLLTDWLNTVILWSVSVYGLVEIYYSRRWTDVQEAEHE